MAATYSKPTVVPRWADTGTRTEPSELEKNSGWIALQKPPAEYFNWILGYTGDWLKWINERTADGPSGANVFAIRNPNDGTRQLLTILGGGIEIPNGLNVGFSAASPGATAIAIGDANFKLERGPDDASIYFDTTDSLAFDRPNNRIVTTIGGNIRSSFDTIGIRFGAGGAPSFPFEIDPTFTGTLGSVATNFLDMLSIGHLVTDQSYLVGYGYRHTNGSTWESASTYLHQKVAGQLTGFVRYAGDTVDFANYNLRVNIGLGVSTSRGALPSLFVDGSAAYAHSFLPRTYYGLSGSLSQIGSSIRPWSTIWMRGGTGTDAHINATGSGGPGVLTLESFDGVTTRGSIRLVGSATAPFLDCRTVNHVVAGGMHSYFSALSTPVQGEGFGFRNNLDVWDVTGMFYSLTPAALRLWKQNRRVLDISGRTGNVDDVQLTLGRGSGAGAGVGDLRDYACMGQDYLAQDATGGPIVQGDLVMVTSTADHAVTRTAALGQTGAIGVAVDVSTANGSIGRIATSGIVLARTAGAGVTRGDYIQASATAGRVQTIGSFGSSVVGVALQTVGSNSYFRMKLRLAT